MPPQTVVFERTGIGVARSGARGTGRRSRWTRGPARRCGSGSPLGPEAAAASSVSPCLPVRRRSCRRPAPRVARRRCLNRTSPPTITISERRSRGSPRAAASAAMRSIATRKNAGDGLPTVRARRPVAHSSATRNAPASRVGPSGVSHHGLRCIPISAAPERTSRNARSRLAFVRPSGESPRITAATSPGAASAPAPSTTSSPANSARASSEVITYTDRPANSRRTSSADADSADWKRSGGVVNPTLRPSRASVARDTSDVFVTTRYGIPALSSRASASTAPGTARSFATRTPSRSSSRPRTPCKAARTDASRSGGLGHHSPRVAEEERMGLLDGRKALVFGVANDHSIAWGIAQAFHDAGRDRRLLVRREPHRAPRPPARGVHRQHVHRALRRPVRRADRCRPREVGRDVRRARHPRPRAWRTRSARTSTARSWTRRATGSRSPSTSRPTRSSPSPAPPVRTSTAAARCSRSPTTAPRRWSPTTT